MSEYSDALQFEALMPAQMAEKAEKVGVKKATLGASETFFLAVMAGAFIAFGAMFATTVGAGIGDRLPFGVARLLTGAVFSLGLILVVVAGAELFTGNNLVVMAWASRRVSLYQVMRNWSIVYVGNFVGSVGTAGLVFASRQYEFGKGVVGANALATANTKSGYGFLEALALGVLCNVLVCLAVWLTYSGRTTTDRILAIVPPITAFVAAGFEHSVANMYYMPLGLMIKHGADAAFWTNIGKSAESFSNLTMGRFLAFNLLPVTIGNIIGGSLLVGVVYWFIYRRHIVRDEKRLLARSHAGDNGKDSEPVPAASGSRRRRG